VERRNIRRVAETERLAPLRLPRWPLLSIPTAGVGIGAAGREAAAGVTMPAPGAGIGPSGREAAARVTMPAPGAGIGPSGREGVEATPERVVEVEAAAMLPMPAPGAGIGTPGREGDGMVALADPPNSTEPHSRPLGRFTSLSPPGLTALRHRVIFCWWVIVPWGGGGRFWAGAPRSGPGRPKST